MGKLSKLVAKAEQIAREELDKRLGGGQTAAAPAYAPPTVYAAAPFATPPASPRPYTAGFSAPAAPRYQTPVRGSMWCGPRAARCAAHEFRPDHHVLRVWFCVCPCVLCACPLTCSHQRSTCHPRHCLQHHLDLVCARKRCSSLAATLDLALLCGVRCAAAVTVLRAMRRRTRPSAS